MTESFRRTPCFPRLEGCKNFKCWGKKSTFLSNSMTLPALSLELCCLPGFHFQLEQIARSRAHPDCTELPWAAPKKWPQPLLSTLDPSGCPTLQSLACLETSWAITAGFERGRGKHCNVFVCYTLRKHVSGLLKVQLLWESCKRRKWSQGQTQACGWASWRKSGKEVEDRERRCSWNLFPSCSQHGPISFACSEVWCCKEKFQTHYSFMLESVDLIL